MTWNQAPEYDLTPKERSIELVERFTMTKWQLKWMGKTSKDCAVEVQKLIIKKLKITEYILNMRMKY